MQIVTKKTTQKKTWWSSMNYSFASVEFSNTDVDANEVKDFTRFVVFQEDITSASIKAICARLRKGHKLETKTWKVIPQADDFKGKDGTRLKVIALK